MATSRIDISTNRGRRPLLIIDIDTGENQKGRIEVDREDDPSELARKFCEVYEYDDETQATLRAMIEER